MPRGTVKKLPTLGGGGRQRNGRLGGAPLSVQDITNGAGRQKSVPIYAAGQVIGGVKDGIFHKRVRASVHQLRKPPAWALDVRSLEDAEAAGATLVAIHDQESGRTFSASIATIRERGIPIDRGHGTQLALTLDAWTVSGGDEAVQQLALWREVAQ